MVLPRRKICIALCGRSSDIDAWEHRMRTEDVDVNSRGRPCRERMLVELLRRSGGGACDTFSQREAPWSFSGGVWLEKGVRKCAGS